jgi:hypothetical protein
MGTATAVFIIRGAALAAWTIGIKRNTLCFWAGYLTPIYLVIVRA